MPLTAQTLKGMWAGLPVPWSDRDELDLGALRENVRRVCRVGVHGVYTHGTTGEFYAQTVDEWKIVARAMREESRSLGIPNQVGCTALWTGEVIRRVAFAQEIGADAVQIAFPFWMPVTDDQAVRFLREVTTAVPSMPVVIYNTERSKKPMTVELLKRTLDAQIPVIGCKGVRSVEELEAFLEVAPSMKVFVGESDLASYWPYGARGCYSSLVYVCPRLVLRYFRLCEEGSKEAQSIENSLKRPMAEYVWPRWQKGLFDSALDRIFVTLTGFLTGSLLLSRPPYDSPTLRDVEECRDWCAVHFPEFLNEV